MATIGSLLQRFSLQSYKVIGDGEKNVFFSPHSVSAALMLVCVGAKQETYRQIVNVLGIDPKADIHEAFKKLNEQLVNDGSNGIETKVANKIYTRTDIKVLGTFAKAVAEYHGGAIEPLDFGSDPESSRKAINSWVEEQTNSKITDLLESGAITPNTKMVIANAIYFKGFWEKPFKPEMTKDAEFNVTSEVKVNVHMMKASLQLPHVTFDDLEMSAVAVPYEGGTMSMIILLPDTVSGLGKMEGSLTSDRLLGIFDSLLSSRKYGVDLSLPKFKMAVTSDLKCVLQKVGISDLFDPTKVDLSGMFGESNSIPITDVVHKAFIEVNEEGTEAAAATAMMSRMMLLPVPNENFRCDRPFMFFLVENTSRCILFMGKLCNPAE